MEPVRSVIGEVSNPPGAVLCPHTAAGLYPLRSVLTPASRGKWAIGLFFFVFRHVCSSQTRGRAAVSVYQPDMYWGLPDKVRDPGFEVAVTQATKSRGLWGRCLFGKNNAGYSFRGG